MSKKFYRSREDKVIGGVIGGMGHYFNIDSNILRIIAVLLILFPGPQSLAYVIAWMIAPLSPIASENSYITEQEIS